MLTIPSHPPLLRPRNDIQMGLCLNITQGEPERLTTSESVLDCDAFFPSDLSELVTCAQSPSCTPFWMPSCCPAVGTESLVTGWGTWILGKWWWIHWDFIWPGETYLLGTGCCCSYCLCVSFARKEGGSRSDNIIILVWTAYSEGALSWAPLYWFNSIILLLGW